MSAPSEAVTLAALDKVQNLNGAELEAALTQLVGSPMLGVFRALAKTLVGVIEEGELGRVVHCMVLAYLLRNEVAKSP